MANKKRTTSNAEGRIESPRGTTFFGLSASGATEREIPDVALMGVPSEAGVTTRFGTSDAARHVRAATIGFGRHSQAFGVEVFEAIRVLDEGDIPHGDSLEAVAAATESCAKRGVVPGLVGGTQRVTLAALTGLQRAKKRAVNLLHLDAFHDLEGGSGSERTALREAIEAKVVRPEQILQLGIRGPMATGREYQAALGYGIELVHTDDVRLDVLATLRQIREFAAKGAFYLSVDAAVLDPCLVPGVTRPSPGGLSVWEVQQVIRALLGAEVIGFDVVGHAPGFDPAGVGSVNLAGVLFEILATIAASSRDASSKSKRRPPSSGRRSA